MPTATIIGSGPNGLSAAIVLAGAGLETTVLERNARIGGACSSDECTLPGFLHDLGSSVFPMGIASPFFRSLPIAIPWIHPAAACAHPLDDGPAILLETSVEETGRTLDAPDRASYRSLMEPLASQFTELCEDILQPVQHVPRHPMLLARFGLHGLRPAAGLARSLFKGARARALFAGMAAHSVLSLESPASSAVALTLLAAGHAAGWPIVRGGAQALAHELEQHLTNLGGHIEVNHEVDELPHSDLVLADVTPRQLLRIAGSRLPHGFRRRLERFRMGAGVFKIDYALSEPNPWTARECSRAATVHIGGNLEEIVASERDFDSDGPFVLVVQPSLFDPARAPEGRHTAWAYTHVPNGSAKDRTTLIEDQIERFAPGFRDCVLERAVSPPAALERWNPNLVGGDILGGAMDLRQLVFRPTYLFHRTPLPNLYLCGASTPPGGGVHGMCGFHAARTALARTKL